jgi:hypothetical protein
VNRHYLLSILFVVVAADARAQTPQEFAGRWQAAQETTGRAGDKWAR